MHSTIYKLAAVLCLLVSCNSIEENRQKAIELNNQGVQLRFSDVEKATNLFKEAIRLDSTNPVGYNNLAGVYIEKGDYDNAMDVMQRLVNVKPDLAEMVFFLAMMKDKLGERDVAQKLYEKSIQLFESRIQHNEKYLLSNRTNRAIALVFAGREQEGRDEIKKLLPEYPSDSPMIDALTNLDKEKYINDVLNDAP